MKISFLTFCSLVLMLTACGGGGNNASNTTPTDNVATANTTQPTTTGSTTPTGTTNTGSTSSTPVIAYNYGSVSILNNPYTAEFKPCHLNNISNSVFVYSCNDGTNSIMSFSFASDTQGKVTYQWIGGGQGFLYNNFYNASYPSIDRVARRITLNNVVLNISYSTGANPAPSGTVVINGSLIF